MEIIVTNQIIIKKPMRDDMHDWLNQCVGSPFLMWRACSMIDSDYIKIWFRQKEDSITFKLKWL